MLVKIHVQCMKTLGLVVQKLWPKFKVKKVAKIRNQVPYLTQDTSWESEKNTITHHKQVGLELAIDPPPPQGEFCTL